MPNDLCARRLNLALHDESKPVPISSLLHSKSYWPLLALVALLAEAAACFDGVEPDIEEEHRSGRGAPRCGPNTTRRACWGALQKKKAMLETRAVMLRCVATPSLPRHLPAQLPRACPSCLRNCRPPLRKWNSNDASPISAARCPRRSGTSTFLLYVAVSSRRNTFDLCALRMNLLSAPGHRNSGQWNARHDLCRCTAPTAFCAWLPQHTIRVPYAAGSPQTHARRCWYDHPISLRYMTVSQCAYRYPLTLSETSSSIHDDQLHRGLGLVLHGLRAASLRPRRSYSVAGFQMIAPFNGQIL